MVLRQLWLHDRLFFWNSPLISQRLSSRNSSVKFSCTVSARRCDYKRRLLRGGFATQIQKSIFRTKVQKAFRHCNCFLDPIVKKKVKKTWSLSSNETIYLKIGSIYICALLFFFSYGWSLGLRLGAVGAELKIEFLTSLVINVQRVEILLRKREVSSYRKSHIYRLYPQHLFLPSSTMFFSDDDAFRRNTVTESRSPDSEPGTSGNCEKSYRVIWTHKLHYGRLSALWTG